VLRKTLPGLAALLAAAAPLAAQSHEGHAGHAGHHAPAAKSDSAFAALQKRGAGVMGVDQYASAHRFDPLPDGGRIALQMRDTSDSTGTRTIRAHLRAQAEAFARGDFSAPVAVHGLKGEHEVPGAAVLKQKRALVRYAVTDLPGGAELRITTMDAEVLDAVRQFLAWQRGDHRVH